MRARAAERVLLDRPLDPAAFAEAGRAAAAGGVDPRPQPYAGFLMLAGGAFDADPGQVDDPERLREPLTSNLCRCTGDEAIRRAVLRAAATDRAARTAADRRCRGPVVPSIRDHRPCRRDGPVGDRWVSPPTGSLP